MDYPGYNMENITIITIILLISGLAIGLAIDPGGTGDANISETKTTNFGAAIDIEASIKKPEWVHKVQWLDEKPDNSENIEKLMWQEISPYKTEYDVINISTKGETENMNVRVIATSFDAENPDIYDFVYNRNELLMTGYLLEAIPMTYRNEAIGIAQNDRNVSSSLRNPQNPSVKRILPGTSEKFYMPKTLLSVKWKGISALVDPDERKVVKVWKENELY